MSTITNDLTSPAADPITQAVRIPINGIALAGNLVVPANATGIVLFAHGSGSSRLSPRNQFVAQQVQAAGIGTLLFDLLTPAEERKDLTTGYWRFDIDLLTHRLVQATSWLVGEGFARESGVAYFGASTGAAAALVAAAQLGQSDHAVVSRGGRPDFAGEALARVTAPTLLIVGERDEGVLALNRGAYKHLTCEKQLSVIPGATHLFEEPGALEEVASRATTWFRDHFKPMERP
jgi:dienelactone hydrolase